MENLIKLEKHIDALIAENKSLKISLEREEKLRMEILERIDNLLRKVDAHESVE